MDLNQFIYEYPVELIATEKTEPSRLMYVDQYNEKTELTKKELLSKFKPGEVIVINDTKVEKRRVASVKGLEVLFIEKLGALKWQVLFPAKKVKDSDVINLPDGLEMKLIARGVPQTVELSREIDSEYFFMHGKMALPPYIEKKRRQLNSENFNDNENYQTAWAENTGSCAAPTASLHFNNQDIESLTNKGVQVCRITLHVGLGTFLPIRTSNILEHEMHSEEVLIPRKSLEVLNKAKLEGRNIWSLGTTATRAIESIDEGYFKLNQQSDLYGSTDLFLYPGKKFKYVTRLMTNFHQPGSTLIALVSAFADTQSVMSAYQWAIKNQFKLFSYGDLTIWEAR